MGDLAEQVRVDHIARSPTCQSGSFAHFLERKLGIDIFVRNSVFFTKIPQHTKKYGRKLLPHPFLLPHQQVDAFPDDSLPYDADIFKLPCASNIESIMEEGPFSIALCRLYVDGLDTGGKSRKKHKKVLVFLWTPCGADNSISARRIITVVAADKCCRFCGCGGRCTLKAIWRVIAWSFAALRARTHPGKGPLMRT